jgi:glycosyltransferase involved in cell wall biosynthesis
MKPRVLCLTCVDAMAWGLLRPWLHALQCAGYDVHIACSRGQYFERLAAEHFEMHEVALRRTFNPLAHVRPLFQIRRLIRKGGFDIVNAHSPVAAAVGRLAAWLAAAGPRVYTVHGFYFHEGMPGLQRQSLVAIEWLLGRITDQFMFVSEEDRQTAQKVGIAKGEEDSIALLNGVNLGTFRPAIVRDGEAAGLRRHLGLPPETPVVGIVGRIVREKGYREFLQAARTLTATGVNARFLVLGDSLPSDRDQFGASFRRQVKEAGLEDRFVFTGLTDRVPEYLRTMDIFVLPSYREGLPRSVLEAMATGLPVVATRIRGCREAVVHGETGLLVPPKDAVALGRAIHHLLEHPGEAQRMGEAGYRRAVEMYDERLVQARFVGVFDRLLNRQHGSVVAGGCARS